MIKTELHYNDNYPQENYDITYLNNSEKSLFMKPLLNGGNPFSFIYRNDTLIRTEQKVEGLRYPQSNDYKYKNGLLTLIITKFDYLGSIGILETELFYEGKNLVKIISNDKASRIKKVEIENVKYDLNKNWMSNNSFKSYILADFVGAEKFYKLLALSENNATEYTSHEIGGFPIGAENTNIKLLYELDNEKRPLKITETRVGDGKTTTIIENYNYSCK